MADLLDIAPSVSVGVVDIGGQTITVRGIGVNAAVSIITRFPALKDLLRDGLGEDLIPRLIMGCSAAVGPIIAAGCGHLGDEAYERSAEHNLSIQLQIRFLKTILSATFPNGVRPFFDELTEFLNLLTQLLNADDEAVKPIKMRSRRLPSELPPSSDAASPPTLQ
jgi:hypothetical protein